MVLVMTNDIAFNRILNSKSSNFSELDGFIKFILAVMITIIPFFLHKPLSFGILSVYLAAVTWFSGVKPRDLMFSAASYLIVFLIPYLFGLLMNFLMYNISGNNIFAYNHSLYEIFLRLFRLFIIWYVSILYFQTTPMKTVIGMLDKLLTPLKLIGIPVEDYLKVVTGVVLELSKMGSEVKNKLGDSMRSAIGKRIWKLKVKRIAQVIVTLIVDSFEKMDKIENFIAGADTDDLYNYRFKPSINDGASILSLALLIFVISLAEKGCWFWI
jgi:energy-coupling factor transporter transmembrane protein EcfT